VDVGVGMGLRRLGTRPASQPREQDHTDQQPPSQGARPSREAELRGRQVVIPSRGRPSGP
jgi:hypothetical protein